MITYMVGKLAPNSSHMTTGWSNLSPVGAVFVPFPLKTGTNMVNPFPPQSLNLSLPLHPAERHLLVAELERVQVMGDKDPNFFSARASHLETTMRAVGIEKDASEIVQFILRQFPERPSNPHALVVGRGFRRGGAVGVGVQRRDDHMVSRDGSMPQQQQQQWSRGGGMPQKQQQHWSRGGGMPRHQQQLQQHWSRSGGMPQQQQQQLHYWSRGGGMSRQQQPQQQWPRGGGIPHQHQRRSHAFPPAQQARQQQPSRIPTIGGDGEDGSSPLSETSFGGDGRAVQEWFPSETVEMPMFSLLEGSQQSAPTAAAAAPVSSLMCCRRVWRKRIHRPRARHRRQNLQQHRRLAVLLSPLRRWRGRPGCPLLQMKQRHRRRHRRPAVLLPRLPLLRGAVGARDSPAGAASTDTAVEAAPSTGDTTAPDASVERAAIKLTSAAGPSSKICGERRATTGSLFPLEVRYHNSSNSSKSSGHGSSSSSNDTTSNHDSWWEATYVGAMLRPFDPGKRCRRSVRWGKAVLGMDLPFDRGKSWGRMQHGG